ncbi:MAG: EAL and HDOD domain-containing protein, partial [Desulfonatronovibrio sp.]
MEVLQNYPVFVARQPIFTREDQVQGYELLFRDGQMKSTANVVDPIQATLDVICYGFDLAASTMSRPKPVYINFPQELLIQRSALALPPKQCVVEILETVTPEPEVIEACQDLKDKGYTLALDDFYGQPGYEKLIDLADIVKVDILKMHPREIKKIVAHLSKKNITMLAEKIEHVKIYEFCKQMGFHLFQGFFFCSPKMMSGSKLNPNQSSRFLLFKELSQDNVEMKKISEIIQEDAALSYRLLRFINSAFFGFRSKVTSIKHAVNLLGIIQVSQWLTVALLSDFSTTAPAQEASRLAAQRGKFLELLSANHVNPPFEPHTMFMLGLFSLLDALLGRPLKEILEELPLQDDVKSALSNPESSFTPWMKLVKSMEKGYWDEVLAGCQD